MANSLVWVDVPCPLCGARRDEPILMAPTAEGMCRLARCGACSMVYLNPRPSDDTLGLLYPEDYSVYHAAPEKSEPGPRQRMLRHLHDLARARYHGYPPGTHTGMQRALAPLGKVLLDWQGDSMTHIPWIGEGRLLDYGCGSGWFASRMRELGWQVTAMDFNADSLSAVAHRYQLPVIAGTLPHPKVRPESFDVITMGAVLEHVSNPHEVVSAVARVLAPGGLLVASVPSINSWAFRAFGADWWGLELPRHLLHFTPATLRRLVEMHGLEVKGIRFVPRSGWLRRSLKTMRRRPDVGPVRRLLSHVTAWGPVSRLIGRWSIETRQADSLKIIAAKPARAALRLAA